MYDVVNYIQLKAWETVASASKCSHQSCIINIERARNANLYIAVMTLTHGTNAGGMHYNTTQI